MISDDRLGQVLVVIAVAAYGIAAVVDMVLAFSPEVEPIQAVGAACVMLVGICLTLYFGRGKDFMGGPLFRGQSAFMGFASGIWISLVLAAAGGFYPVIGAGRFIPYMGYVGSLAFIPPILVSAVFIAVARLRGARRK